MNVIEQAKIIRAKMDDREKRVQDIKALTDGLTAKPHLADLLAFLRKLKEVLDDGT